MTKDLHGLVEKLKKELVEYTKVYEGVEEIIDQFLKEAEENAVEVIEMKTERDELVIASGIPIFKAIPIGKPKESENE